MLFYGSLSLNTNPQGFTFHSTFPDLLWKFLFILQTLCYGLNVCAPPKFLGCSPNPQSYGIWRWDLWEIIRFRWDHKSWSPMMGLVPHKKRERSWCLSLSQPGEDTSRRRPSTNQEEGPQQTTNLLAPWSWTELPRAPELTEKNACCLIHLVYGILL